MAFNPMSLVLGSVLAEREGVADPQARTRIALLGGLLGSRSLITGLVLTTVFARREAESASAPITLVQIPSVEDQNVTEAKRKLEDFGLEVLTRDAQSNTVPKEAIIRQDPAAFTLVLDGATVTLTVSQGFVLPDVRNEPLADAQAQLNSYGLQVQQDTQDSETVPNGSVISQDPAAFTLVSRNDTVRLAVSQGFELPDVVTNSRFADEAETQLHDRGLRVRRRNQDSETVPNGSVISQEPAPSTRVSRGDAVTLTVSQGFELPDVVTNSPSADVAETQLRGRGLLVRQRDQTSYEVPKDSVVAQEPAASTRVSKEDTVTLTVSQGFVLPDVRNEPLADAQAQLNSYGLQVQQDSSSSEKVPQGSVVSQEPEAFTRVSKGDTVTLTVSQPFELPGVTNRSFAEAKQELDSLGLQVKRRSQNSDTVPKGSVSAQRPPAGTLVSKGDTVTLTVSKGSREASLVELPELIGQPFREAREELQDLDFKVKRKTVDSDRPKDEVVDQDPKPGKVDRRSQVTLSLSNGSGF